MLEQKKFIKKVLPKGVMAGLGFILQIIQSILSIKKTSTNIIIYIFY